jgi:hypothetical protein
MDLSAVRGLSLGDSIPREAGDTGISLSADILMNRRIASCIQWKIPAWIVPVSSQQRVIDNTRGMVQEKTNEGFLED